MKYVKWIYVITKYILGYFIQYITSFFPTSLPIGMTAFDQWATSIIKLSSLPDNDSTRFGLAASILHLDSTQDRKAKRFFVKLMNKGAANQIASGVMQELKEKQQRLAKEEAEKVATSNGIGATNGQAAV